ncbi:MAG: tRNA lysidine(34) synthetase TilS [Lascolabacillus sp.]|jgi:tRNA(Ile)-lysidine synthase|uniref:tRNA lysidine(34) synthetase TilS n=1 Tax=Lascolabacillus sp. TaxID=1924068 RepID=UPI002590E642|nr:tRNA lysidine(34) synthetase TilS [Lascolabacillus sp.]MCK9502205.1 tRNA lysidine(34) synthetase TilS [Lascolabacillus sp.]MDD4758346.1 tRNA lysidine(34) synthetase TilS [Lascolabacillus sp.]
MIDRVQKFIQSEKLLPHNAKVIVGLSGGMDSMVLLDLLVLLEYRCIAAHCNFHLRGAESDRDADFVRKWCKNTDIPFTSIDFDTTGYAEDRKISIEMAARELRYEWFEILRKQYEADAIAVAHHRDDSVETVLLNLIRGTGIKGLSGISPRNGYVVRPLLTVSRSEIEDYIIERELPYVTDSTNDQDIYLRNYLRLNVIPKLEVVNPSVKESIIRTSKNISEAEKIYSESIREYIDVVFINDKINIPMLKKTASPQSVLFELLSPLGFTSSTIEDIFQSMDSTPGKVFLSDRYRVIKDRSDFILEKITSDIISDEHYPIEEESKEITFPVRFNLRKEKTPVKIEKKKNILYADADKLKFPLIMRRWKAGDWFIPFGMNGKKKLSDYFTDRKFSLKDKKEAWVILSGENIVWIVNERSDNRYKITDESKNIFIIEYVDK